MVVDVVSDVRCPWCYVGHHQLKRAIGVALSELPDQNFKFDVRWHPFFLDDSLCTVGVPKLEYYNKKFGSDSVQSWQSLLSKSFAEEGLGTYGMEGTVSHSLRSHRLIALAEKHGLHSEISEELFAAYFSRAENIACVDVLTTVARNVGLLDHVRAST